MMPALEQSAAPMSGGNTPNWIRFRRDCSPQRRAIECGGSALTFAELSHEADVLSGRLAGLIEKICPRRSCEEGEPSPRIAVLAQTTIETCLGILGALQAGIQVVPLNTRLSSSELARIVADCSPTALLYDSPCSSLAMDTLDAMNCDKAASREIRWDEVFVPYTRLAEFETGRQPRICDTFELGRIATIMYTSGTTGIPKGVMHSFGAHYASALQCASSLRLRDADFAWGCMTPLCHVSGFEILMRSLVFGCSTRLYSRFDAREVVDDIYAGRLGVISAVSYQIERLLDIIENDGLPRVPSTLRVVLQGGGPLSERTLLRADAAGLPVAQSYGMTETTSNVVCLAPEMSFEKRGSCGRPCDPVAIGIKDQDANGIGRIWVETPTLASGYLGREDLWTSRLDAQGRFDTQDLGHIDKDGYLYVDSRLSDLIVSGGENIFPSEVEAALLTHPMIEACIVVGVPDEIWGSVPCALCCLARSASGEAPAFEEIVSHCKGHIASYKCPRHVFWVDSLPMTSTGKPRRLEASRLAASLLSVQPPISSKRAPGQAC